MTTRNPIDSSTLLACLQDCDVMVTEEGITDLRMTLKDLGFIGGGNIPIHTDIEDVEKAADELVAKGEAIWMTGNWLTANTIIIRCQSCSTRFDGTDYLDEVNIDEINVGDDCGTCDCGGQILAESKQ